MKLCTFISGIAGGLIEFKAKVGRPSLSHSPMPKQAVVKAQERPSENSQGDCVDHFPVWDTKRQRCKFSGCDSGFSYVKCMKCNVHLCLNKE